MSRKFIVPLLCVAVLAFFCVGSVQAWTPVPVVDDPLVRMPGTQPGMATLEGPGRCLNCHADYNQAVEPGFNWKGSMMAQASRDFLFWSCMTVAAQDSIWAVGTPNATDICERCHFPIGWLEGRSDPTNASLMRGDDYDGVNCDFCHNLYDPYFETTYAGTREGNDWLNYWDETNVSSTPSDAYALDTYNEDSLLVQDILLFSGQPMYVNNLPVYSSTWDVNGGGQYFVSPGGQKRSAYADAAARHQIFYSRYHKSKYLCSTCHDISNPVLANAGIADTMPNQEGGVVPDDGSGNLITEQYASHSYFHVERTFSEFMLSDYGQQGGAPGIGPFAPDQFDTSYPNNNIAKCQDCHMRDVAGVGCNKKGAPLRPDESIEHPESGLPLHDLTGGNAWVSWILASAMPDSPNFDPLNFDLMNGSLGPLTLDMTAGQSADPVAILAGVDRSKQQLLLAASIDNLNYDAATGDLSFQVQNRTGHKLISGFPECRRMFVNVVATYPDGSTFEVNPYDAAIGTLKGLDPHFSPSSPALAANEVYVDELVYESHTSSALTGEEHTLHFALATGRSKDNRIPPKGFRIAEATARLVEPWYHNVRELDYFTAAEYAGGYDAVTLGDYGISIPDAATVEVNLYYQTTSREYIEFLRDEINGVNKTLYGPDNGGVPTLANDLGLNADPDPAYLIQADPFFADLRAWGDTLWQLWDHNKNVPGGAPFLMTQATTGTACETLSPILNDALAGNQQATLTWSAVPAATYNVYYDQAGKAQLVASGVTDTTFVDSGLTNGQEYCYKVSAATDCESGFSNILCATPQNQGQTMDPAGVDTMETGRWVGKGKNQTFELTITLDAGDSVVIRARVTDGAGIPVASATVEVTVGGPESVVLNSGPSDADGWAEATWNTQAPNKKGLGGTTVGSYTATTSNVTVSGYHWDMVTTSAIFSLQ